MPTLEVLAEVMEESGKGITVGTVDCTVYKTLCTNRFNIRVRTHVRSCLGETFRYCDGSFAWTHGKGGSLPVEDVFHGGNKWGWFLSAFP